MRIYRGISLTDAPNLQNITFPLSVMLAGYSEQWNEILPSFLAHDATKPIGFSAFNGIALEPKQAYLLNSFYEAESEIEIQAIKLFDIKKMISHYWHKNKECLETLRSKIEAHIEGECKLFPIQAAAYYNKGIVCRVCPEFKNLIDDKGLIDFKVLHPVLPGVFKHGEFLIFAHKYFRRNLSYFNAFNQCFLRTFQALRDKNELTLRIALDLDLVGLAGTEENELEFQYWFGPKFNNDLSSIEVGVTKHENEFHKMGFTDTLFTEFWWYVQDNKKTFECEEVNDRPNIKIEDIDYYGCRFVHTMLDSSADNPVHMDGAIRAYTDEKMLVRMEKDIRTAGRHTDYKKIWRLDGSISVETWKELLTHYYQDNFQVGEYLGGKDKTFDELKSNLFVGEDVVVEDKYIPCDLQAGDGVLIYYKILPVQQHQKRRDISIKTNQYIKEADGKLKKAIEADTITLIKLAKRYGASVVVPKYALICCEDMVINFPIFICKNANVANCLQKSIKDLCTVWYEHNNDRVISYTIQIVDYFSAGNGLHLSFAGHIEDLWQLWNKAESSIPGADSIEPWIEQIYKINKSFKGYYDVKFKKMLLDTGEFHFQRQFVDMNHVKTYIENKSLCVRLLDKKENLYDVERRNLRLAPLYLIEGKCSKCGKNYVSCKHIKFIDDVGENISNYKLIGIAWTNRHSQDLPPWMLGPATVKP